jgi:hypothetical protein
MSSYTESLLLRPLFEYIQKKAPRLGSIITKGMTVGAVAQDALSMYNAYNSVKAVYSLAKAFIRLRKESEKKETKETDTESTELKDEDLFLPEDESTSPSSILETSMNSNLSHSRTVANVLAKKFEHINPKMSDLMQKTVQLAVKLPPKEQQEILTGVSSIAVGSSLREKGASPEAAQKAALLTAASMLKGRWDLVKKLTKKAS